MDGNSQNPPPWRLAEQEMKEREDKDPALWYNRFISQRKWGGGWRKEEEEKGRESMGWGDLRKIRYLSIEKRKNRVLER